MDLTTDNLISLAIAAPISYLSTWIDWEETGLLIYVRLAFLLVQALLFVAAFYIHQNILMHPDNKKITAPVPSFFGKTSSKTETLTVTEYDEREWRSLFRGLLIVTVVVSFLHLYSHYIIPLLVMIVVGPFRLWSNKLFQIYIMGKTGADYQRPFKSDNQLAQIMDQVKEMSGNSFGKRKKKLKRPSEKTLVKIRADQNKVIN